MFNVTGGYTDSGSPINFSSNKGETCDTEKEFAYDESQIMTSSVRRQSEQQQLGVRGTCRAYTSLSAQQVPDQQNGADHRRYTTLAIHF